MDENAGQAPPPSHPLRWLPEFLEIGRRRFRAQGRLLGAAIVVGIITGIAAVLFAAACQLVSYYLLTVIAGYKPLAPAGEPKLPWIVETTPTLVPWLLVALPCAGGLISGAFVYWLAPEARGHGTDAAIAAYHVHGGEIRARVPLIKLVASAITLGSGGSGGKEGPIAQIGAGCGSVLGKLLRMPPSERRTLLAAGIGAGIAAIFRAPLAGALFAAEVLYRSPEFEADVIMPAGIASVISYCTFGAVFGWRQLFDTDPRLSFENPWELAPYTLLAICMAMLAMVYTRAFSTVEHRFLRWKIPPWLKPMVGATATGVIGLCLYYVFGRHERVLSVISFGYGVLQDGLLDPPNQGDLTIALLLAVAIGKIVTTTLTIGSGGSGGVFGPSMVIGGCAGGALGLFVQKLAPQLVPCPASFMIVGMAGFFAAAAKTPFSTIIIVCEMTGGYQLLLPALWVCTLSFLLSDEQSLYASQVEGHAQSPAHRGLYIREVLAGLTVAQCVKLDQALVSFAANDSLEIVLKRLSRAEYAALPVIGSGGQLLGVIALAEAHLASQSPNLPSWVLAADIMRVNVEALRLDDRLDYAQEVFAEHDLPALPLVDRDEKVIGMVRRSDIAAAYLQRVHGERNAADRS